jgi:hypothetical protein
MAHRQLQPVAALVDRLDDLGRVQSLQRGAQRVDAPREALVADVGVAPDAAREFILGDDGAAGFGQRLQGCELLGRQPDGFPPWNTAFPASRTNGPNS